MDASARTYLEKKISRDGQAYKARHMLAPLSENPVKHLKLAVSLNPRCVDARNDLALALFRRLGDWENSVEEFKRCLQINPHHSLAHTNLAAVYASRGMYDKALVHAEAAGDGALAHRNLARLYDAIGNSRLALKHNALAIQRDKKHPHPYRRVAVLAVGRGETRQKHAHAHYDAYRALANKGNTIHSQAGTEDILAKISSHSTRPR